MTGGVGAGTPAAHGTLETFDYEGFSSKVDKASEDVLQNTAAVTRAKLESARSKVLEEAFGVEAPTGAATGAATGSTGGTGAESSATAGVRDGPAPRFLLLATLLVLVLRRLHLLIAHLLIVHLLTTCGGVYRRHSTRPSCRPS